MQIFLCHCNFAFGRCDLFIIFNCLLAVHLEAVRVVQCLMKMCELAIYSKLLERSRRRLLYNVP